MQSYYNFGTLSGVEINLLKLETCLCRFCTCYHYRNLMSAETQATAMESGRGLF